MCGRYSFAEVDELIEERFGVRVRTAIYKARYNCAPGQALAVISNDNPGELAYFRWGLIPFWAKDPAIGNKLINARAETIAEKPSFRNAFKKHRCLIVADGFYEWQKLGKIKKALYFSLKSERPFGFAGLHETWVSPEHQSIHTCTIITTEPNELINPIHDRMPVIVEKDREVAWIDPANHNQKELLSILKPYPSDEMTMSEVDPKLLYRPKMPESAFFSR